MGDELARETPAVTSPLHCVFMADVALVWVSMTDENVNATREQVRAWAGELGLSVQPLSRSNTVKSLRAAAANTVLSYTDEAGAVWVLDSEQSAITANFETHTIYARPEATVKQPERGGVKRLGEVKLFLARRTSHGVVRNSERMKTLITPAATELERAAVQQWLAAFDVEYTERVGLAPVVQVRHVTRLHLRAHAWPVGKHKFGLYFCYVDRLPTVRVLNEFVRRCAPGASFTVLPIEAGPEQHQVFAEAADDAMETALDEALALWTSAGERRHPTAANKASVAANDGKRLARLRELLEQVEEHERRLGWPLPRARRRLRVGVEHLSSLPLLPTDDLLAVIDE
jgi:hypothetical protein